MDEKYPRISVITPNYNFEKYIERTITSVLDQKYPNLEYIIYDGGSTDKSYEIIKKYDKYISFHASEDDNGQTHALSKGFNRATGDILAWLNSDDTFQPGALQKVADIYNFTKFDLLYGDSNKIDIHDKFLKRVKSKKTCLKAILYDQFAIPQMSSFWSKNFYEKVGGLDLDYKIIMDRALYARFFSQTSINVVRINDVLSNFRIHSEQSGSRYYETPYSVEKKRLISDYTSENIFDHLYYGFLFKNWARLLRVL
ncbi:MAG: glycosyltransferase [Calditrichaeota bacterium]|nr:MAG: glycosyltransferase [Calditrichota bacterium]